MDLDLIAVGELSRKDYLRINKNDSLETLIKALLKKKADRALVFSDESLEGIVTIKDILSIIASSKRKKLPLTALHVSSVMSSPIIKLPYSASLLKAARIMINKNISSVVVEDKEGNIYLFTKWEIAKTLKNDKGSIREIIGPLPPMLKDTDSLLLARKLMLEKDNPILPVTGSGGNIIGILTPEILLNSLLDLMDFLVKHGAKNSLNKIFVGEILRPYIPSISFSSSVGEAASLMIDKAVKSLLVFSKGKLVGSVTLSGLIKYVVPPK